jgi:hypothetical protein
LFNPAHLPREPFHLGSLNVSDFEGFADLVARAVKVSHPCIVDAAGEHILRIQAGPEAAGDLQRRYENGLERVNLAVQSITPIAETIKQASLDTLAEHEQRKAAAQPKALPAPAAPAPTSTQPPTTAERPDTHTEWLAKAMLIVRDHPYWSDAEIARRVGKNPGTLSRSTEYKLAADLARGSKTDVPQGHVKTDSDSGLRDVEAVAPPAPLSDDKTDRGQPIPGSKYVREYCTECGEPIKVTPERVGTKPLCDHCAN